MRSRKRFSQAGLLLAQAGIGQADLARPLGVTPQAISNYLSGERTAPAALFTVIAALGSTELADAVRAVIEGA